MEVLKQPQYAPVPVEKQVAIIYAVTNGFLDDVDVKHIRKWEADFIGYLEAAHPAVLDGHPDQEGAGRRPDRPGSRPRSPPSSRMFKAELMAKASKALRGRIRSVQNTRKITRTMELVSTSKLKRAQDRVVAARPYAEALARGHRRPGHARSWPSGSRCSARRAARRRAGRRGRRCCW